MDRDEQTGELDELDCEIHVPISPTPQFFNQIRLQAASIRRFGGPLRNSRIIVTVGGGEHTDLASQLPWSRAYGVEWRWLDPELFARHDYFATALERFRHPFESKYVLFLDADVLPVSPPELAASPVIETGGIAGLIAFSPPFETSPLQGWAEITRAAGLGEPPLVARYSGWGVMDRDLERQWAPPYFNLGVLFCSSDAARALSTRIYEEMEIVNGVRETVYRCQIALTLAILRLGIPWYELPLRLNFPNLVLFWRAYRAEAARLQLMHCIFQDEINRSDFVSEDALRAAVARPVENPLNRLLQERIRMLLLESDGDDR